MNINAWVYESSLHCPKCAISRFGANLIDPDTCDKDGNPLGILYSWDWSEFQGSATYCNDCNEPLNDEARQEKKIKEKCLARYGSSYMGLDIC